MGLTLESVSNVATEPAGTYLSGKTSLSWAAIVLTNLCLEQMNAASGKRIDILGLNPKGVGLWNGSIVDKIGQYDTRYPAP